MHAGVNSFFIVAQLEKESNLQNDKPVGLVWLNIWWALRGIETHKLHILIDR